MAQPCQRFCLHQSHKPLLSLVRRYKECNTSHCDVDLDKAWQQAVAKPDGSWGDKLGSADVVDASDPSSLLKSAVS